ncbi:MAG: transporter substrate-binding domain-containing protein [Bacteroidales bacterium]
MAGNLSGQETGLLKPFSNSHDTIVVASEPDYPPYCTVDKDGNATGFSVELFQAAAEAVGIVPVIKIGVWDKIKNDLSEGRIDALPLVGRTPEREELFDFTMPYLSLHGAVFVRKGTEGINSVSDLREKEVVVMKGDNAEEYVRRDSVSDLIFTTNTFEEAFKRLAAGQYDALITQRITGIHLLEELEIKSVQPLDFQLPRFRQDFCFAVQEGDTELLSRLNEGLSIIIADETFNNLQLKWFGPGEAGTLRTRDILRIALYIFVPLLLVMALVSFFFMRAEVRRQTRSLNEEIKEHKQTAESLRKQKLLLNEMEKVSKTGGWERYPDSDKSTWTNGTYDIYGLSPESFNPSDYDKVLSFYKGDDGEVLDSALEKLMATGEAYDLELRIKSNDGINKWVRTRGLAEMSDGEVKRVYGNILDITETKLVSEKLSELTGQLEKKVAERTAELKEKIEKLDKSQKAMLYMVEDLNTVTADLKEERKKLEASNREMEAFSYSVSHDLRAPLRSINGFSRFLLEDYSDKLDEEGKRLLNVIRQNAKKMDELINDMLKLSRISRAELNISGIDMTAIAKAMYEEVAGDQEKELFQLEIKDLAPARCDPSLIKNVWQNLLGNALKYSAGSEIKKIELWSETDDKKITYFVKDHGAGFDMKYRNKLFGVFKRLHRESEFEGTGVGLAIVQRIIHKHGGEVDASAEPGKGAVFSFSLPVALADNI